MGFNFSQFGDQKSGAKKARKDRMPQHSAIEGWYASATGRAREAGGRSNLYFLNTRNVRWETDTSGRPLLKDVQGITAMTMALLPLIKNISYSSEPAISTMFTFGAVPARQAKDQHFHTITITGVAPSMHIVAQTQVEGAVVPNGQGLSRRPAVEVFDDLVEFLERYKSTIASSGADTKLLIFQAPYEDKSLFCEPMRLDFTRRSDGIHFGYEYTLTLRAWGKAEWAIPEYELYADMQELSFLETLQQAQGQFAEVANRAEGLVVGNLMHAQHIWTSATAGVLSTMGATLDVVGTAWSTTDKLAGKVGNVRTLIGKFLAARNRALDKVPWWENPLLDKAGEANLALLELYFPMKLSKELVYKKGAQHKSIIEDFKRGAIDIPYPGWNYPAGDVLYGGQPGYQAPADSLDPEVEIYVAKSGDTFRTIATAHLGIASAWPVLVALNGGTEADFLSGHKPLHIGAEVKVPAKKASQALGTSPSSDPYLVDYLMDLDGDLALLNSDSNDVKVVTGPLCLKQGLEHRLTMRKGESLVYPDNGLSYGAGDKLTMDTSILASQDVENQIRSDPRISGYKLLELVDAGNAIEVNCRAEVVSGASVTLTVPVDS